VHFQSGRRKLRPVKVCRLFLPVLACALFACGGAPPAAPGPQTDDTLEAHARAQDAEGLRRAALALRSKSAAERIRAMSALLEYEPSKLQPLLAELSARALRAETPGERAAAAWVLVHAGDARVASSALADYGAGTLQKVARLDGSSAFDVVAFGRLLATTTVPASQSASRRDVMTAALSTPDPPTRALLVGALAGDSSDATPLVTAAESLDPKRDFFDIDRMFRRVRQLADPRAADALARYADHVTFPYFRTEAAVLLAELGDLRAAPHLAWRLTEDPSKLYDRNDPRVGQLVRDDRERVVCARMLGELALMHPEARVQLRETAEHAVTSWMKEHAQPHAAALRFFAVSGSPQAPAILAALADPQVAIPAAGAPPPFPAAFETAQSALRYLGATHDASAFAVLLKQLRRKPAAFDASMESLAKGGTALAGMTYRALGMGAADGFSELGDPKAVPPLVKVASDPKQNEHVRVEACRAVAWLADARERADVVSKLHATATRRKHETQRTCWLDGLSQNPRAADGAQLLALVAPKVPSEARHLAARVIGLGGADAAVRDKLVALLKDRRLVHDAALALLFGGDEASVKKVLDAYAPSSAAGAPAPPPMEPLRQLYAQSVPILGERLYESGALARMARLALAARAAGQRWVLQGLAYQLRQVGDFDAGPHTLTRVRLRAKLLADARGADTAKRDDAVLLLWLLGERASLAALGPIAKARLAEPSP
jgi:hypothetical protein